MGASLIRYITGRGGTGVGGLSAYLATLDDDFDVLAIDPEFLQQDIQGQVDATQDFINLESGNVIANSYGAYLLLLSLIDQPPLPVRTLLPSPVLGRAISEERMLLSRPPREKTLHKLGGQESCPRTLLSERGAVDNCNILFKTICFSRLSERGAADNCTFLFKS